MSNLGQSAESGLLTVWFCKSCSTHQGSGPESHERAAAHNEESGHHTVVCSGGCDDGWGEPEDFDYDDEPTRVTPPVVGHSSDA